MPSYKGQCLCGVIQYEVDKIKANIGHCHCKMCRKFHGAAFSTFGEASKENFRWLQGEDFLQSYKASNGTVRQFCRQCGSSMTFKAGGYKGDLVEFSLGTLDSDIDLKPDAHVFVSSKANWVEICDDLPQFAENRGSKKV